LITSKCTTTVKEWLDKCESFRIHRYMFIAGRCLYQIMSEKIKVAKTKTAVKQKTYILSDLKHGLQCGFVELGDIVP
jgi:hypothetical protein